MDAKDLRELQVLFQERDEHRAIITALEKNLKHAHEIADAERRARERAEDSARRAWAVAAGN